jgi:hypothetical protein
LLISDQKKTRPNIRRLIPIVLHLLNDRMERDTVLSAVRDFTD